MCIKYGKGYAMEETTLLYCDFSEGITDAQKIAQKREKWSMFFGIYDPERKDVTLLLYRTPNDIRKGVTKAVAPGQKAGFIHMEPLIEIRKEPLIVNPSPFVMDASKVTMNLFKTGFTSVHLYYALGDHEPDRQEPVHLLLGAARPLQDPVRDRQEL